MIVNPIAGMGGAVGLKGTDGVVTLGRARSLGARPQAAERAKVALRIVAERHPDDLELFTGPGVMGQSVARAVGLSPVVIGALESPETVAGDTRNIAEQMQQLDLDLILFAGGDGTARDICAVLGSSSPTLGIPAGVKMHSAVHATSPRAAGDLASRILDPSVRQREAEVMDIDEEAFRSGRVSAKLYGYLMVPYVRGLVQNLKSGSHSGEAELGGIAAEVEERMGDGSLWILGPGTTTRAIAESLRLPKTLLGVDLYCRGEVIVLDATEEQIRRHVRSVPAWIVVTPIGGQGYIFGRGNQQLSPDVIRAVGRKRIVIIAPVSKLASLRGEPLLVDTGDTELDREMRGHVRVVTNYRSETVYRIA